MSRTQHAFDFLEQKPARIDSAVCVLFGDESFLKREVKHLVRDAILSVHEDAPFATFDGDSVTWRDVSDELSTVSLFGGGAKRLVMVENADKLVTDNRDKLEAYVQKPKRSSVLILDVSSWASNTRLYKCVDTFGMQVDCRLPQRSTGSRGAVDEARIVSWLVARAESIHKISLPSSAAKMLVEVVGTELGLLDQDLAKLALFADAKGRVTSDMVRDVVGGWKTKTIWQLCDAAADGDAGEALRQLDHLLQSGEPAQALFGQISWSLRRFAVATRVFQAAERRGQRLVLREALQQAGFRPFPPEALPRAEKQLMQLGRNRAGQLFNWLLDVDLALKGSHSTPDRSRFALEQLFLRLAKR